MIFFKKWLAALIAILAAFGIMVGAAELIFYAAKEQTLFFFLITGGCAALLARGDNDD